MKLIRIPLLVIFTIVFSINAFGQKPQKLQCALSQAPSFRGFYLGMSPLDVRSKLEDTTLFDLNSPPGKPGSHAMRISAAELKEDLAEGIDEINIAFVDGRLALIKVTFNGSDTWNNAQDFLLKTTETLGVPKPEATNTTGDRGNEKYKIECTGFAVAMAYSFGVSPNLTINDMTAQRVADERLQKQGEVKQVIISPQTTRRP